MLANLNGWHAVILLVIILLLFGAPKLPGLAKSLGQSMKIFKAEVKTPASEQENTAGSTDSISSDSIEGRNSSPTGAASTPAADEQASGSQTQHKP